MGTPESKFILLLQNSFEEWEQACVQSWKIAAKKILFLWVLLVSLHCGYQCCCQARPTLRSFLFDGLQWRYQATLIAKTQSTVPSSSSSFELGLPVIPTLFLYWASSADI